ncbi:cytochrome aa3 quinol oxidase subunit IV [Niallia sp. XMNu-256]|uniref:cytochrome aa3 quinol oxidase subunit IV n=1 Tax=Niallia sp. XMNu-256 TaxID=3082444 RepID=UPI0030CDCA54
MKELFPVKQINGFVASILLTVIALSVIYFDLSFNTAMAILLITAFTQAFLQFVVFMHAGETDDKGFIFGKVAFMMFASIVTILGTLLLFLWDM